MDTSMLAGACVERVDFNEEKIEYFRETSMCFFAHQLLAKKQKQGRSFKVTIMHNICAADDDLLMRCVRVVLAPLLLLLLLLLL